VTAYAEAPHELAQRIVPPQRTFPRAVDRPRLAALLADLPQRSLTALVAGAGYGKTTLLAAWAAERHCAWYTVTTADQDPLTLARGLVAALRLRIPDLPQELADSLDGMRGPGTTGELGAFVPALAASLHGRLRVDLVLLLDNVELLEGSPGAVRVLAALCHMAPDRLHLALASRTDLPFAVERIHGRVSILDAEALGFDADEVAALLDSFADPTLGRYAGPIRELTGGRPATAHLVAMTLADRPPEERAEALAGLAGDGVEDLLDRLLEREVMPRAPEVTRKVMRIGAAVDRFDTELLRALGVTGVEAWLGDPRHIHLVDPAPSDPQRYTLTEAARRYAVQRLYGDPDEPAFLRREAAAWYLDRGEAVEALQLLVPLRDSGMIAKLLGAYGPALLASGHVSLVLAAVATVRAEDRSSDLDLLEGEAHQIRGDWDRAVACLGRLVPATGPVPVAVAWRLGLIHHMRGELRSALDLYRRGLAHPAGGAPRDQALAAAWGAAAAWLCGEVPESRALTARAAILAERSDDHTAAAAAYTAQAMLAALDGDRSANDRHYLLALDHARRAGDVLHVIRIRSNRGSRFLEEGQYGEAYAELETAVRLSELADFPTLRNLALVNRAEVKRRLGQLDEAVRDLTTALAEQRNLGSRLASYPLVVLGDVHLDQGNTAQAQACFEEAVRLAESAGDLQALVPALAGLATATDDLGEATRLAAHAVDVAPALGQTRALLAVAKVAVRRGDRALAASVTEATALAARARRDRAALAEALVIRAELATDQATRRHALEEAEALWATLDCPIGLARARIALAALLDREAARRLLAATAVQCRRIGARRLASQAADALAALADAPPVAVGIRTLGGFAVTRQGRPVAHDEWPSAEAVTLLGILVAKRGTPVPVDVLVPLLQPTPPEEAAESLRAVLDPDRVHAADHYIATNDGTLRLHVSHVDIDVETFLTEARATLARGPDGTEELSRVEARYTGDFCAEELDADWAIPLRLEARGVYVSVVRALAEAYASAGDPEATARCLLRLLAQDPYDEPAHLALVRALDRAGRYGEAGRMYRGYAARMAELGVEPAAYPSDS
jgi:ATP/maltotriose-dependent transcriptional regulator MalT/DNA-binding SARP family transcriptional activator